MNTQSSTYSCTGVHDYNLLDDCITCGQNSRQLDECITCRVNTPVQICTDCDNPLCEEQDCATECRSLTCTNTICASCAEIGYCDRCGWNFCGVCIGVNDCKNCEDELTGLSNINKKAEALILEQKEYCLDCISKDERNVYESCYRCKDVYHRIGTMRSELGALLSKRDASE